MINSLADLPNTFYRVAAKALVFDASGRLLVVSNQKGDYEIPGGGWEFSESYEACLRREISEELGVGAKSISSECYMWTGVHHTLGHKILRIGSRVTLASDDFMLGDGMTAVEWIDESTFLKIDWKYEGDEAEMITAIWENNKE